VANIYVDIDLGSDSNPGTQASPYKTFSKGVSTIASGDTLYLEASTTAYAWTGKTFPANVSIIGSVKPDPVAGSYVKIDGFGASLSWIFTASYNIQNIWLNNVVNSTATTLIGIDRNTTGPIVANYTDCMISNMASVCSTAGRGGVLMGGGSVSAYKASSITFNMTNCVFKDIEAYNSTSAGCLFINSSGTQHVLNMTSCSWYQGTPTRYALDAIVGDYASNLSTVNIKNMAIVNNSGQNLTIHGAYGSADMNAWYSYDIDGSTYTNIVTTNGNITNSTNADAMYLDPATNDFRLKPTSPAIDRGVII